MGVMQGLQTKMQLPQIESQVFQGDTTKRISVKNFVAGFTAQAKNKTTLKIGGKLVDKETAQKRIMDYMFGSKKQESEAFMQKVAHQPGVVALGEGVYGKQLAKGIAIPKMTVGSTWEIYVPYQAAYGEQGTGPIPPFAALTFKVTLVSVNK